MIPNELTGEEPEQDEKPSHSYFISYSYSGRKGAGIGNINYQANGIFNMQEIKELQEDIAEEIQADKVVIINWIKFDKG